MHRYSYTLGFPLQRVNFAAGCFISASAIAREEHAYSR
jgi:hypothetical protein